MVPGGASLAQHPAVSQGKINEEHDGEEDPAGGDMEARNDFRESVIPKHNEGSDSDGVAEEHGKEAGAVNEQGPALPEAIPIENRHDTKKVIEEFEPVDSRTLRNDGDVQIGTTQSRIRTGEICELRHKDPRQRENKTAKDLPVPWPHRLQRAAGKKREQNYEAGDGFGKIYGGDSSPRGEREKKHRRDQYTQFRRCNKRSPNGERAGGNLKRAAQPSR